MRHIIKAKGKERKRKDMAVVLIANSSEIQRRLIQKMMVEEGHNTLIAESGGRCIDLVDREQLDCVLLDSHISNHRGLDVLESIKTLNEDLPVVILSGGAPSGLESSYSKFGAQGIVSKPANRRALMKEVNRAISHRHSHAVRAHHPSPLCDL